MKKFLSNSVEGTVRAPAGVGEAFAAGDTAVVVVAGDIAVAGVVPAAGEIPVTGETPVVAGGTTGLVPVTVAPGTAGAAGVVAGTAGLTAAGLVVVGGGEVWPNEVSARVTEQRLAISSFFIGLIGKFSRARIDELVILLNEISASRAKLSRLVVSTFRIMVGATIL